MPEPYQQSAMMKTDAGTCASLSVSLLTTSFRLSNHFLLLRSISGSSYISSYIRAIDLIIYGSGRCVERTKKVKKRTKKARDLTTSPIPPGHALFGRPSFFGTWDRVADISISAKAISTHLLVVRIAKNV